MHEKDMTELTVQPDFEVTPNEDAVKKLPPELQEEFKTLKKILEEAAKIVGDSRVHLAKKYYAIGKAVCKACRNANKDSDETQGKVKRHEVEELLASALGISNRILHDAAEVALKIPKKEFDEICKKEELTWNHAVLLSLVGNSEQRVKLTEESISKNWSVRELRSTIRERSDRKQKRGTGRLPGVPATARGALSRMAKGVDKLRRSFGDVWLGERYDVVAELADLDDKVPKGLKEDAQTALESLESLQSELPGHVERMREGVKWIDQALASDDVEIDEAGIVGDETIGQADPDVSEHVPDLSDSSTGEAEVDADHEGDEDDVIE